MLPFIIIVLIELSLLIFFHEIGHFLAAKKAGIKVEEFGFGYPPRIFGKKLGETIYSINLIPFGGFVRLLGQEAYEAKKLSPSLKKRSFYGQSKKAKAFVLLAGILGNVILGVLCFTYVYAKIGIPQKLGYLKVEEVLEGSPAQQSGLKKDDQIFGVDNKKTITRKEFVEMIGQKTDKEVMIETARGQFKVTPKIDLDDQQTRVGILITDTKFVFYPWWQMPFRGAWEGIKEAVLWLGMVFMGIGISLYQLFTGVTPQVGGPVKVIELTVEAAKAGVLELIQFIGILSVNLAVINFLPFPALDGGHLAFLFIGDFLGEKRREKVEHTINLVGFVFLITLMVLVTINDIRGLLQGFSLASWLKSFMFF